MYTDPPPCKYLNLFVVLFLLFLLSKSNTDACNDPADDHIGAYQTPEFNNTKSDVISYFFNQYGKITKFSMNTYGKWQTAYITYEDKTSVTKFYDTWAVMIMDFMVRVFPQNLEQQSIDDREAYSLKLAGLPPSTNHRDLFDILCEVDAKYCHIPKTYAYRNRRFAFIGFANEDAAKKAFNSRFRLKNCNLQWVHPDTPLCQICANPNHNTKDCGQKNRKPNRSRDPLGSLYEKYKPAQYRSKPQFIQNSIAKRSYKPTYGSRSSNNNLNVTTQNSSIDNAKSYSLAVRNGNRPITNGTAKGGSVHQNKPSQQTANIAPPSGNFEEILAALHRSVLDIQKDLKEIKVDLENFKQRVIEVEHNVESFTNPGPNFIAKTPSQVNIDMDII